MTRARRRAPPRAVSADELLAGSVRRLTQGWIRLGKEEARKLGLNLPQLFLMNGLHESGEMPVARWLEFVGVSPSAMTAVLDGLEAEGYVARRHDAEDRRQVLISLTAKGRRIADRLDAESRERWKSFCAGIPAARLESTSATLERIVERMHRPHSPLPHVAATRRDPEVAT